MSKLKVYLSLDGKSISSVVLPGVRTLHPVVPGWKKPIRSYYNRWVIPCESHLEAATVTLDAFSYNPDDRDGTPAGRVKICFLCWALLEKLP